jgi:hypothetical protein
MNADMTNPATYQFRRDKSHSRPSSRRGSGSFTLKISHNPSFKREDSMASHDQPVNGLPSKESNASNHSLVNRNGNNQIPSSVSFNLNITPVSKDRLAPGTPPANPKNHKIGNNNWLPKLDNVELGSLNNGDKSQDFSASMPLLGKSNVDSVV